MYGLKLVAVIFVGLLLLTACDEGTNSDSAEAMPTVNPWVRHDSFLGMNSIAYMSEVVGNELFVQEAFGIAKINMDNDVIFQGHRFFYRIARDARKGVITSLCSIF